MRRAGAGIQSCLKRVWPLAVTLTLCLGSGVAGATSSGAPEPARQSTVVRAGQTLSAILRAHGYGASELMRLLDSGEEAWRLGHLKPGHRLELVGLDGRLEQLTLQVDVERAYRFTRAERGFEVEPQAIPVERRRVAAEGVIGVSLFNAARRAGLSNGVILSLAGVFEWDVDLRFDLRKGDRFAVVYEELYRDGKKLSDGAILAAELVSGGRTLRAVRYQDPDGQVGYYTPEGASVQKAFLRSPVEFARVSSGFSHGRRHPVLHSIRAHRGVDYAAAPGTPIRATADGTVRFAGRKGGFGKTVILAHGGQHTTLYAHLLRFARGVRPGARVKQGQVIGQVGSSGLATGPHVHYEFRVQGVHKDSRTVRLPEGESIPERQRADFLAQTTRLVASLERLWELRVAALDQARPAR